MPASLRFVVLLLGLGVVGALASGIVRYRETQAQAERAAETMTGGRVAAGKAAIERPGCGTCHVIPGVAIAKGRVGPSLRYVAVRPTIGGKRTNDPANLVMWIRTPQHISPGTAMPDQAVSETQARDISAYLYTLHP